MKIRKWAKGGCLGASLMVLAAGAGSAATAPAPGAPATAPAKAAPAKKTAPEQASSPAGVVEPRSVAAVVKMSAYLRSLATFEIKMTTERDDVDDFGQLLTFDGTADYKIKKPDAFALEVTNPNKTRQYIYDGKTVIIFDPKSGYYATIKARPDIRQTLDMAADQFGITVPFDDLFKWDEGDDHAKLLTSGHFVRSTTLDGQEVDQYAFRQPGVDWQIWIAKGDKPLPLRVVITASDDPARPQFEANLSWDTAAQFAADTFVFTAPANAKPVPIQSDSPFRN